VIVLSRPLQQRLVRRIVNQRVLEDVLRTRAPSSLVKQFGIHQLVQSKLQRGLFERDDRLQHFVRKFPPEDRTELRNFANRRQPIQSRHQQVLQRGRNGDIG